MYTRKRWLSVVVSLVLVLSCIAPGFVDAATDKTKPTITGAKNTIAYLNHSFNPKKGVVAKDNVDGNITSHIKIYGKVNTKKTGKYTLTYKVTDKAKNTQTVKRVVTVKKDTTKPKITGVSNKTVYRGYSFNPKLGVKATDNADGNLTSKIKVTGKVNTKKVGKYKIKYTVTDKTKNKRTVTRTITVKKDTTKPTISGAFNKTIYAGTSFKSLAGVTAKDNADGNITKKIKVSGKVNTKKAGTYKLTYTVSDKTKNKRTVTRKITVKKDTVKPTISGAKNKSINIGTSFNPLTGVSAKDNADGNITKNIKVSGTVNTKKAGSYKLTYSVSDKAKNKTTVYRTIKVIDNVKPVINGITNIKLNIGETFNTLKGVSASDNNDGNLTSKIKVSGTVNVNKAGTYKLTYSVSDKSGNKATKQRTVTVVDNIKPVIKGVEDIKVSFGLTFDSLKGVSAADNNDGDLTAAIKVDGEVDVNKVGTYKLVYTVKDKSGNVAKTEREVSVVDDAAPVINGAENVEVRCFDDFDPMEGVTASDNRDGDLTSEIKVEGTVNVKEIGTYELTYSVTDQSGNKTSKQRTITVIDNVDPVISGVEDIEILFGQKFDSLEGIAASDNYDGNLTSKIEIEGTVNVEKAGDYSLTYSVTDKSGNKVSVKRTVTVIDNSEPVLSGVKDIQINFGEEFDPLKDITATDNNDGDLTSKIKVDGTVNVNKAGDYKLTYSVSDQSGNAVTANRTVTVIDNVKPVISGVSDVTIGLYTEFNLFDGVSAYDNNDGDLTSKIKTAGSVDTEKEGEYAIEYEVSDAAGNTEKISRVVTVQKIPVSEIYINGPATLRTGKTQQLTVEIAPTDATEQQVTWKSSDESIATISEDGILKTIEEGTVTITASADGKNGSLTIYVSDPEPYMYFSSFGTTSINDSIRGISFKLKNLDSSETVFVEKVDVYKNGSLYTSKSAEDIKNAGLTTEIAPYSDWQLGLSFSPGIPKNQGSVVVTVKTENGKTYQYSYSF